MKKLKLSPKDTELVEAAMAAVKKPVRQLGGLKEPALVGAALRLKDGRIITSVNLIVDVGSISMCAEPLAIAEANRFPDVKIETIVAVYNDPDSRAAPKVIPPCGRCREVITDYAGAGYVILRDPGKSGLYKVSAAEILPLKYAAFWSNGRLI